MPLFPVIVDGTGLSAFRTWSLLPLWIGYPYVNLKRIIIPLHVSDLLWWHKTQELNEEFLVLHERPPSCFLRIVLHI